MRQRVPRYYPGDVLYAERLNRTVQQSNRLDNKASSTGINRIGTTSFDAEQGPYPVRQYLVRIKCDTLPEGYADATADNRDEFNAVIQTWDPETSAWVDEADREVQVEPKDNLPLLENDLVHVILQRSSGKFLPASQDKEAFVRIPDGTIPDQNGFYYAYIDVWDNDALTWVTVRDCYARDANS